MGGHYGSSGQRPTGAPSQLCCWRTRWERSCSTATDFFSWKLSIPWLKAERQLPRRAQFGLKLNCDVKNWPLFIWIPGRTDGQVGRWHQSIRVMSHIPHQTSGPARSVRRPWLSLNFLSLLTGSGKTHFSAFPVLAAVILMSHLS